MKQIFLVMLILLFCGARNPTLKVLIIGDSISNGYTPFVKKALEKKALVIHNPGNAQSTGTGLQKIDEWLGKEDWDVILFNWGLWDLCYRNPKSKEKNHRDKINGKLTTSIEDYRKNLGELVQIMQKTGSKLIFVTTTMVPANEAGRIAGDEDKYNAVALEVMKKNNIAFIDLNQLSHKVHSKYGLGNDNVHYTQKGYELLSELIVNRLNKQLIQE